MAGVAQDEVRKLSERLKFGFNQAIKNGHVLGNDKLWGYDKKDCVLTINQREAAIIRQIFDLYGNQRLGIRKISQKLCEEGYTSRRGNAFNEVTIRHILCNPMKDIGLRVRNMPFHYWRWQLYKARQSICSHHPTIRFR